MKCYSECLSLRHCVIEVFTRFRQVLACHNHVSGLPAEFGTGKVVKTPITEDKLPE